MNISCKLFLDDVQEAIFKSFHQKIDLSKEDSLGNALLAKYILAKVHLAFGHSAIQLIWKGYEIEEEAVWCYFYGKMNGNIQDLSVRNELLFECFDDQIHFIHCMYHEQRKSIKLHQQEPLGKFNF